MTDASGALRSRRSLSISSLCNSPSPAASASDAFSPPLSNSSVDAKLSFDEQDEDVKMAISALHGMRSGSLGGSTPAQLASPFSSSVRSNATETSANGVPTRREFDFKTPGPPASASRFNTMPSYHTSDTPTSTYHTTQSVYEPSVTAGSTTPSMSSYNGTSIASPASSSRSSLAVDHLQLLIDEEGEAIDADGRPVGLVARGDGTDAGVFLGHVGRMPLVSGVVRAYERGKGTSRVVKYGADLVESSVTSIGGRVASRVGPERIAQFDRYAGAALDRIAGPSPDRDRSTCPTPPAIASNCAMTDDEDAYPFAARNRHTSSGSAPEDSDVERESSGHEVQVVSSHMGHGPARSRWQNMLVEAGMTAGGIGAAVSEESMKSLKYCLQWLQYANAHMDHQITVLRDLIATLQVSSNAPNSQSTALISASAVHTLTQIKSDVVETIRKVVDVVSKYAGGALPEPAKAFVRKSILSLPVKWATAIYGDGQLRGRGGNSGPRGDGSREGTPSSVASTPLASPRLGGMGRGGVSLNHNRFYSQIPGTASSASGEDNNSAMSGDPAISSSSAPSRGATEQAAERVLTFAIESLDMLKSVSAIFGESVDRADAWVERLRILGVQHRRQKVSAQRNDNVVVAPIDAAPSSCSAVASDHERLVQAGIEGSSTLTGSAPASARVVTNDDEDDARSSVEMSSSISTESVVARSATINSKRRKVYDSVGGGSAAYASAVAGQGADVNEVGGKEREEVLGDGGLYLRRKRALNEGEEE